MLRAHAAVSPATAVVEDHFNQSILCPVTVLMSLTTLKEATVPSGARHDHIDKRILNDGRDAEHAARNEWVVLSSQDDRRNPDAVQDMAGA